MKKEQTPLIVINFNATGIGVGRRTHFVAIGQEQNDVKSPGVYASGIMGLSQWLFRVKVFCFVVLNLCFRLRHVAVLFRLAHKATATGAINSFKPFLSIAIFRLGLFDYKF